MKTPQLFRSTLILLAILATHFTSQQLHAQTTWSGGGLDNNWSTPDNWGGIGPIDGDGLIFAGATRPVNTNDLALTTSAWMRFDNGGFALHGNPLTFAQGITNVAGTNIIGLDLSWSGTARFFDVAAGSELVMAGNQTLTAGDHTYVGGGVYRLTGTHVQSLNPPATILNNIEYVIDGGSFSSAGGVRITSGTTPTASKLILTNGGTMNQTLAAGAIRVGDFAGITGELIINNCNLIHSGGNIGIGFAGSSIGIVKQYGGMVSNAQVSVCQGNNTTATYDMVGGTLVATQIRKNGSGTATITFDGAVVKPVTTTTFAATFFTGLNTAEIKAGGLVLDDDGIDLTVGQALSGTGGLTKTGSGTLTLGSTANAYLGGFTLNQGTVSLTANNVFGTGTLTVNGGTMQPSASTGRNCTNEVTLGGNYTTAGNANLTWSGPITLAGDRAITVNNTGGAHVMSGSVGESGGARSITKLGPGILQLTGSANTYSGNTTVSNGAVQVNGTSRLGNEAGTLVLAGGTFQTSASRSVSTAPIGNPISLVADSEIATTSTAASVDLNLTGVPAGSAGTLTFRNLAASGTGTFEPRFSAGGFTFSRPITLINNTNGTSFTRLNFFNTNGAGDQTFSAVISGDGGIRRSASTSGTGGRTIFTTANTYSGTTTINDGTLVVNNITGSGTGTGDITLGSAGILAGTGSVAGTVSGTGSISPGASAGTITLGNGLDLSSGGTNIWELGANTVSGAGTSFDQVAVTGGNVVLGGNSRVLVKFIGTATFPDSTNAFWQQTNTWKIIALSGGAANPGLTVFAGVDGAAGNNAGNFTTSADATGVYLTFKPGVQAPPPVISSTIVGAGTTNAQVSWSSVAGATYKLQYKTNLNQVGWLDLTNLTATGTTTTIADTTSPVPAERYYRVISP